ncbi:hypothetical protein Q3G72_010538 [Acer saccharum]|nr:hypothetical protein Q3G72_010538 [Acer saccharum]
METWFIVLIISISIAALFSLVTKNWSQKLPPSPHTIPIIGNLPWLLKPQEKLEIILGNLHKKYGPIFTLYFGAKPAIFVATASLAHQALVQNSTVFADRPTALPANKIISCNQHNISSASYGSTWRLLRRNLTSEILNPLRVKSYSHARKRVLEILVDSLHSHSKSGAPVHAVDHFRYAMFCLLAQMCFGDKLEEKQIKEIERAQRRLLLNYSRFEILNFWPRFGKILFRKRWKELYQICQDKEHVLVPFIKAQQLKKEKFNTGKNEGEHVVSYVDTLLDLQLPEENNRKLEKALQWIMANLVKYPQVQEKLFMEMIRVLGDGEEEVREEYLQKVPYVKAVVLEGLRRHPPGHFVLPHAVTQDTMLNGFVVPKEGVVNFMVAGMGLDSKVWKDPMAFKPERFLESDHDQREVVFDITGSREIKMMPFGAGRRICPGYSLAMLHLEYFVANLVWKFQWKSVEGDDVDLAEKQEFTTVMKYPLQVHLSSRVRRQ